jgi:hypothetical protein
MALFQRPVSTTELAGRFKAGGQLVPQRSDGQAAFAARSRSITLEAGLKLTLAEGAARLDIAVFDGDYDDLQVSCSTP